MDEMFKNGVPATIRQSLDPVNYQSVVPSLSGLQAISYGLRLQEKEYLSELLKLWLDS